MSERLGPFMQMGILAERMASVYQMDRNLELGPHLSHYMDEVDVNIAADRFDHIGFMTRIRDRVEAGLTRAGEPRQRDFLQAVSEALVRRIEHHAADDRDGGNVADASPIIQALP